MDSVWNLFKKVSPTVQSHSICEFKCFSASAFFLNTPKFNPDLTYCQIVVTSLKFSSRSSHVLQWCFPYPVNRNVVYLVPCLVINWRPFGLLLLNCSAYESLKSIQYFHYYSHDLVAHTYFESFILCADRCIHISHYNQTIIISDIVYLVLQYLITLHCVSISHVVGQSAWDHKWWAVPNCPEERRVVPRKLLQVLCSTLTIYIRATGTRVL